MELGLAPLESVTVDPASAGPVELSLPDEGLTVTVADPSTFQAAEALTASAVSTPLSAPAECYESRAMFDISAETQTQFDAPLTVTMSLEKLGIGADAELSDLYVGWWSNTTQGWIGVPAEVDAAAGTVTFQTSHLTVFGWFMSKAGYERRQAGKFEIIWDAKILEAPADMSDPDAWAGKIVYATQGDAARLFPDESWATDATIPPFVRDTAAYLNHALKLYKAAGFKIPSGTTSVVIETSLSENDSRNKALDVIHIGGYNTGAAQLKGSCAHELFHAVQNEYLWDLGGMMFLNWWCESTSEYASFLAWAPARPGRTVPPKYFSERLDSTNYEHEYESAYFISDLVGSGSQAERFKTFRALWTGTLAQHGAMDATDMIYPLSLYLLSTHDDLNNRVNDHVYRVCLMPGSPMAGEDGKLSPDTPVGAMMEGWATLAADEEEASPMTMTLKGGHRAKLWGARVRTVKSDESRPVELELSGDLPASVTATVHVLPGGRRSDRAASPQGRFTAESRKVKLTLTQDDEVYVVVVNHGSKSRDFALSMRGATMTILDHLHETRKAWVSIRTNFGDGYTIMLACEDITWSGTSFSGSDHVTSTDRLDDEREKQQDRYTTIRGSVSADALTLTSLSVQQRDIKTTRNPVLQTVHEINYDLEMSGAPVGSFERDHPEDIEHGVGYSLLEASSESPEIIKATAQQRWNDDPPNDVEDLKLLMADGVEISVNFWKVNSAN